MHFLCVFCGKWSTKRCSQFLVCGGLQISVDLAIIYQVFKYAAPEANKIKHHVVQLKDPVLPKYMGKE